MRDILVPFQYGPVVKNFFLASPQKSVVQNVNVKFFTVAPHYGVHDQRSSLKWQYQKELEMTRRVTHFTNFGSQGLPLGGFSHETP